MFRPTDSDVISQQAWGGEGYLGTVGSVVTSRLDTPTMVYSGTRDNSLIQRTNTFFFPFFLNNRRLHSTDGRRKGGEIRLTILNNDLLNFRSAQKYDDDGAEE